MTKKELSQLYYLNKEIDQLSRQLAELEAAATSSTSKITGMPHAACVSDKTAISAEIADVKDIIKMKLRLCKIEYKRLNRYINTIDDSYIRQIFRFRYIERLSWQAIAFRIGEHDEQYPRRKHNTFLNLTKMTNDM